MSGSQSLHDTLNERAKKLQELKSATVLLRNKDAMKEQLAEAKLEIASIVQDVGVVRQDLVTMKAQNDMCRNWSMILTKLNERILYMTENIPPSFIQDTKQPESHREVSPYIRNGSGQSTMDNGTIINQNQIVRRIAGLGIDTPLQHSMEHCKKTLFKSAEDSYTLDPITEEEFIKIPKYMIGRQSLATVNELVTVINQILHAKYSLLEMGKAGARKKGKLDLYLSMKREEVAVQPGEDPVYFFTAEDYFRHTQLKLDKMKLNLLIVLRHCKRLRESRVGKILQYRIIPLAERSRL